MVSSAGRGAVWRIGQRGKGKGARENKVNVHSFVPPFACSADYTLSVRVGRKGGRKGGMILLCIPSPHWLPPSIPAKLLTQLVYTENFRRQLAVKKKRRFFLAPAFNTYHVPCHGCDHSSSFSYHVMLRGTVCVR